MPAPIIAYAWMGGKFQRYRWIRTLMPEGGSDLANQHYIEPFFGAGSVLLNRPPAAVETVSDINNGIVDFFLAMRDSHNELLWRLNHTPYSREEFRRCLTPTPDDRIENARRFIVRTRMGVLGKEGTGIGNWQATVDTNAPKTKTWRTWLESDTFQAIHRRLQNVAIDSRPAIETIEKFDSPRAMFYCDPPYLPHTNENKVSAFTVGQMSTRDHYSFCELLKGVKGMVAVSGYDCPEYDEWLPGWYKHTDPQDRVVNASGGLGLKAERLYKREAVWTNFTIQQRMMFDD